MQNKDGSYKWKLITEDYKGHDISFEIGENGERIETKKAVKRQRKILLYWSKADAEMAAKKREEKLRRAEKSTKNNAYGIPHGKDRYVKEETVMKETGEVLGKEQVAKATVVDKEKAEKDAKYDGYFAIITGLNPCKAFHLGQCKDFLICNCKTQVITYFENFRG